MISLKRAKGSNGVVCLDQAKTMSIFNKSTFCRSDLVDDLLGGLSCASGLFVFISYGNHNEDGDLAYESGVFIVGPRGIE